MKYGKVNHKVWTVILIALAFMFLIAVMLLDFI